MITAIIIFISMSFGAGLGVVVAGLCAIQKDPAASELPLPEVGGPRGRLDYIPGQSRATASPLVSFLQEASGRGLNLNALLHTNDYRSAESVDLTIEADKVWLDVDGMNVFRAYNIGIVQVDDRRTA